MIEIRMTCISWVIIVYKIFWDVKYLGERARKVFWGLFRRRTVRLKSEFPSSYLVSSSEHLPPYYWYWHVYNTCNDSSFLNAATSQNQVTAGHFFSSLYHQVFTFFSNSTPKQLPVALLMVVLYFSFRSCASKLCL